MASLPFLVGKVSRRCLEEAVIIFRCRLVLAQVVVGRGPQKIADREFGQKFGAGVQRLDHQFIILVFIGGRCQIAVCGTHAGLELKCGQQFPLGSGNLRCCRSSLPRP